MNWHYKIIPTTPAHLFLLSLLILSFCATFNVGKTVVAHRKNITCIDQERDALLKFKHHINQYDDCGLMDLWGNPGTPDCCTWEGVTCSNQSGHVTGLNLSGAPYQEGYCLYSQVLIPPLCELKRLKYLDLSYNNFQYMVIPTCIGSLVNLIHLNLSYSDFSENIPHQLGNLTRLKSLDLSNNNWLYAKSLNWVSRLSLLRDINLSGTDLSLATDWTQSIGSLPLLEVLQMDNCQLSTPRTTSSLLSANIRIISLSRNDFNSSSIFQWLFNTTSNYSSHKQSLEYLDLSNNLLKGPIPDAIGNLEFLTYLDLSQNSLSGTIPDAITNLQSLTHIDLSYNSLSGPIPSTLGSSGALGTMHSLSYLDLSSNLLQGPIPDAIGNSEFLKYLDLSQNSLSSKIPDAIGNLKFLEYLDLSWNSLSSKIPDAIGNLESVIHMDLSNNSLSGPVLPTLGVFTAVGTTYSLLYLDLSNNHLEGAIPSAIGDSHSISHIDLSNNQLQGSIPSSLGKLSSLSHLDLSNNHLESSIPATIGNMEYLVYLDLSSNNLSGEIPCKFEIRSIPAYVNFSYNNLSGSLPKYFSNVGFGSIEVFQGNPNLRTDEFKGMCGGTGTLSNEPQVGIDNAHDKDKIYPGLYVSIGLGFYTGFWVFCGTLTLKNSWRHAYFRFLDHIIDKIYVIVAVYLAKFRSDSQV